MDPEEQDEIVRMLQERSDTPEDVTSLLLQPSRAAPSVAERGLAEAIGATPRLPRVEHAAPRPVAPRVQPPAAQPAPDDEERDRTYLFPGGTWSGLGDVVGETVSELPQSIADMLTSAAETSGIGNAVERMSIPRDRSLGDMAEEVALPGLAVYRDLFADRPGHQQALEQGFSDLHGRQEEAAARSPRAARLGGALGYAAPMAIAPEAEGAALAPSLARSAIEGAGLMGLTSEGTTADEVGRDMLVGGTVAPVVHGLARGAGALVDRAVSPEARRAARRAADRQRIASVRGEAQGTISHRDFENLIQNLGRGGRGRDEQVARAAQAVRDSRVVGPFSSASEIADRVGAGERRTIERMEGIRAEADANGASVPADAVPDALTRYADGLDPLGLGRWADAPRAEADIWRGGVTPGAHGAEMRRHPAFGSAVEQERARARATMAEIMGEDIPPPVITPAPGPELRPEMQRFDPAEIAGMTDDELRAFRERRVDQLNAAAYAPQQEPIGGARAGSDPASATVSPARRRAAPPVDPRRSAAAREGHVRRVERDEFVGHDLPEELAPVWEAMGPRERARFQATPHASRAEVFADWAHNHSADVQRMQIEAQERGLDEMWQHQPSDATPTPSGPAGPILDDADALRADVLEGPGPMGISDEDLLARIEHSDRRQGAHDALRAAEDAPDSETAALGMTIPRQRAEEALRVLDRTTQWTTPSGQTLAPDDQVAREMRHVTRDTIDDAIAPFLTPERMAEYPAARREYSQFRTMGDVVRPAEERAAGRSTIASSMTAAAPVIASGGSGGAAALAGAAYRSARSRGASLSATYLEGLSRAMDAAPEVLARWRPRLERARRAGTLDAMHALLSREDPEYAAAADRAVEEVGPDEAEQMLYSDEPAIEPAATDREAQRAAARRELARRELARRAAAAGATP